MKKVFVSGLVNVESSIKNCEFPMPYSPIEYSFNGINSCVSGVGFNVSLAFKKLGDDVVLSSFVGDDILGELIKIETNKCNLNTDFSISNISSTGESIILVDQSGKRKIYCDLKNLQEENYSNKEINRFINSDFDLYILTNINFNRELLFEFKKKNKLIASDVHCIYDINDDFNRDFMINSDILFLSNEYIKGRESEFLVELYNAYHNKVIVVGCGDEGALAYVGSKNQFYYSKAIAPKGIVSTVGAGDALFSSFLHFYINGENVETSLKKATIFAGIKISSSGGSNGFVSEEEILKYI